MLIVSVNVFFRALPDSHAVSIDSLFGEDIDASAILPEKKQALNFSDANASQPEVEVSVLSARVLFVMPDIFF